MHDLSGPASTPVASHTAAEPRPSPEAAGEPGFTCRICGASTAGRAFAVREMMFGYREEFEYFQCLACDCLQIREIPLDFEKFYPADYYAHQPGELPGGLTRDLFRTVRNAYSFTGRGLLGRLLHTLVPYPAGDVFRWFQRDGLTHGSAILDVGCGAGLLLRDLSALGYRNVWGVDPFIESDPNFAPGVRLLKGTITDVDGAFDLIMLHHSLEHIPDQLGTMTAVARRLTPTGVCLVRIPVVTSYAWEHYRENWVQIDAPRHFYLHSVRSMQILAEKAGLRLLEVAHDSTDLQFVGSEMYRRDIPLTGLSKKLFSRRELRAFSRRARELNRTGRGDMAAFFLVRTDSSRAST